MPTTTQVLCWKNIPTQVKATGEDGDEHPVPLTERFQQAVDALAMKLDLAETDEYLEFWNWSDSEPAEGAAQDAARRLAAQIEAEWPAAVPAMVAKALAEAG